MANLPGAYLAKKKNGLIYYRASVTYRSKHLSLGSFNTEQEASLAYYEAVDILTDAGQSTGGRDELMLIDEYMEKTHVLSFDKWIMLKNFRENGMYCRNPIYLRKRYFLYFIDINTCLKFDAEDLFYYMSRKIMKRGRHLFVADYGMQVNILSRYGIKNHAVEKKDYRFINGDNTDFRYSNIEVINRYYGVSKIALKGKTSYLVKIHVNGDFIVGRYYSEEEAAIAYNKAADELKRQGVRKSFAENYIEGLNGVEYLRIYKEIKISKKIKEYRLQH